MIDDPKALAQDLFSRGRWQRVHIIDRHHLAWVAQQAQAIPQHNSTLDAYYHLVYTLIWDKLDGYVCVPPRPDHWQGWRYTELRDFLAQIPSPGSLALGVYSGSVLSIGVILVLQQGRIRQVTTFESLAIHIANPGPTPQTLTALCEALDSQFAPAVGVLLCSETAFSGWLAASDKRNYLAEARTQAEAIWLLRADA
jgi:hypothetical protein